MKADLVMAIHFHQPVGNFDHVIERACDKCYMPFMETLKKYPDIKMSFHFSGCLLEWAENKRPELVDMVCAMVRTGQVEPMGGAFYEPILPSIPQKDRVPQIAMLSEYIKSRFSYNVKGAWIAERVWEPELPSSLYDAGIKYTILDETHFLYSGVTKEKTYGHYITEDNSKPVSVFPSDKVFRYFLPFRMPEESIDYMRGVCGKNKNPTFVYGDDGEKFGEWPETHKWVFQERWLEKFFDALVQNKNWLNILTCSECLEKKQPLGRIYFPTTSYEEMLEWALPVDAQQMHEDVRKDMRLTGKEDFYRPFVRGGFWRNFLSKYPESDHMNKKMIHVSRKLESVPVKDRKKDVYNEARQNLFRGQCNCAYWHGVFGGLYLFHLRRAVYHHLIKSEVLLDRLYYGKKSCCGTDTLDIDADGLDEIIMENRDLALYFDPADGGILKELDSKTACHNLINTLARRKEAYHRKITERTEKSDPGSQDEIRTIHELIHVTDPGIKEHLVYDKHERYSLIDHFFKKDVSIEAFSRSEYSELGDFIRGNYGFAIDKSKGGATLVMERRGLVDGAAVAVAKEITLPKKGPCATVKYTITNESDRFIDAVFAAEFNITMPDADSEKHLLALNQENLNNCLNDLIQRDGIREIEIRDPQLRFSWQMFLSQECCFWHFPVRTVSSSEKAYELNYQGSAILPKIELALEPSQEKKFDIQIKIVSGQ